MDGFLCVFMKSREIAVIRAQWSGQNVLQWRHNGRDSVSNHQPHDCLLNRLFRRRSKKTSKLRVTGLLRRKCFHLMTCDTDFKLLKMSDSRQHVRRLYYHSDVRRFVHHWSLCEGNQRWPVDSPLKGPHYSDRADNKFYSHCKDDIMGAMASQITSLTIVYSTVYSGADHRKHQSSASLAFVRGIHRWPVYSPHKGPVMGNCFHLIT